MREAIEEIRATVIRPRYVAATGGMFSALIQLNTRPGT